MIEEPLRCCRFVPSLSAAQLHRNQLVADDTSTIRPGDGLAKMLLGHYGQSFLGLLSRKRESVRGRSQGRAQAKRSDRFGLEADDASQNTGDLRKRGGVAGSGAVA
jgi:hypothetical protein